MSSANVNSRELIFTQLKFLTPVVFSVRTNFNCVNIVINYLFPTTISEICTLNKLMNGI